MSFQPPPPPPGGNPPPPPGQWGPPPGAQPAFDPKNVNQLDWAIMGAGVIAFIFSLFDWYSYSAGGFSESESAWNGFFGWFGVLLALAGSVLVLLLYVAPQFKLPISNRLAGLGCYAVSLLCIILALFVDPEGAPDGIDFGHGFGYWITLIAIVAGGVISLMRLQQSGEKLPGALGSIPQVGGGHGPQGGQPPQAGYGPPQPGPGYGPPPGPGPQPGPGAPPPPGYGPPR